MSSKSLVPINAIASSSAPTFPTLQAGDLYFNTGSNTLYAYTGSAWVSGGGISSITAGTGLTGGTITSSGTIAIDSTVATLTGGQTLTNKVINGSNNTITNVSLTAGVTGTLPVANGGTGITSLGTGVATFLGTPTSANLASAVTDETGSGSLVFATSPSLTTPSLGVATATSINSTTIPSSATLLTTTSTSSGLTSFGSSPSLTTPKITLTYTAKTAAYTFASGDEGNIFSMNASTAQQFNIPTDATFNFAIGTQFNVFWLTGAGQPTVGATTPGTTTVISTGATSATPKLRVANSMATVLKIAANSWIVIGDIS